MVFVEGKISKQFSFGPFILKQANRSGSWVEIGLLVLAVSAGAPLLPRKLLRIGDGAYIFSLVVTSSLLVIVLVPAWLAALGPQFGNPPTLESSRVAWVLAKSFFLPLALGMLVRWRFPAVARQVGDRLMAVAGLVLTACSLALLILHWDVLLEARWGGVLTLAGSPLPLSRLRARGFCTVSEL